MPAARRPITAPVQIGRDQRPELDHPASDPLTSWYDHAKAADWQSPQDIKNNFRSVDFVGDNRVIFDIGGNNYRLVVRISYTFKQVLAKLVGPHKEYDQINPETV